MVDVDIVEKRPVTLAELRETLASIKKDKNELNFRADKVYVYLEELVNEKKSKDVQKKLSGLGIQKLKPKNIVKIADILPEDPDALKAIFIGETVTLKQEELKQILDVVNE